MKNTNNHSNKKNLVPLLVHALILLTCGFFLFRSPLSSVIYDTYDKLFPTENENSIVLSEVPEYAGVPYVELTGNVPHFTEDEMVTDPFEEYSELDSLGRCGTAYANVCKEIMPTEEREDIREIYPTGWVNHAYDFVDQEYVYNRCHLIGYQLAGENANERNLITGTRYLNVEGMLPFENEVAEYVRMTGNHVLYRVTPIFKGRELVARGVEMEAQSVEDHGEGVCFHVYVYNVQPGVEIDYRTGDNHVLTSSYDSCYDVSTPLLCRLLQPSLIRCIDRKHFE